MLMCVLVLVIMLVDLSMLCYEFRKKVMWCRLLCGLLMKVMLCGVVVWVI